MPASLLARQLSLSYGNAVVLDGLDVTIGSETRLGVIGPNGTGKSSLLKVLAGLVSPDAGVITKAPTDATVGYLPQEPLRDPDETVVDALSRRVGVAQADVEFHAATSALSSGEAGAEDRYALALEHWLRVGAADFDARVAIVAEDLGLSNEVLQQPTSTLSGGQGARASLASILLARFDIVLLDEPTNDLDFDGLERLERFVDETSSGVVIVSHDRAFLEHTITSVLELDEHSHHGTLFNGGWLSYLEETSLHRRHAEENYEEFRSKRKQLEDRARLQRQWAVTGARRATKTPSDNDKMRRGFSVNRTEKQAAKVRITERALDRLGAIEKPWEGWKLHLEIESAPRSGEVVFRLAGAVVDRSGFRLGPIDLEIAWAERVAILGANGSGKTTLLDALLGRVSLNAGARFVGPGVIVGEFDQTRRGFGGTNPLDRAFSSALGNNALTASEVRSLLAKFGLGANHIARPSSTLSPGERARAVLATFMARRVNCLVLDEPTNHLDLPAIEQLEVALESWNGTLLVVSHDRRLLDAMRVDRTIEVVEGQLNEAR